MLRYARYGGFLHAAATDFLSGVYDARGRRYAITAPRSFVFISYFFEITLAVLFRVTFGYSARCIAERRI
jgi:hypothetical protein